jgi:flavin-dependent dehydrogenase
LFFIGDAARVVEPFTGEGIYYALRSGELAAEAITQVLKDKNIHSARSQFARKHRAMYRGRLWINQLARAAVLSPRIASAMLEAPILSRAIARSLTRKIVKDRES